MVENTLFRGTNAGDYFPFMCSTSQSGSNRPYVVQNGIRVGVKGINTLHITCTGTMVSGGIVGVKSDGTRVTIQGGGETSGGSYSWDKDFDVSAYDYLTNDQYQVASSVTLTFSDPR